MLEMHITPDNIEPRDPPDTSESSPISILSLILTLIIAIAAIISITILASSLSYADDCAYQLREGYYLGIQNKLVKHTPAIYDPEFSKLVRELSIDASDDALVVLVRTMFRAHPIQMEAIRQAIDDAYQWRWVQGMRKKES